MIGTGYGLIAGMRGRQHGGGALASTRRAPNFDKPLDPLNPSARVARGRAQERPRDENAQASLLPSAFAPLRLLCISIAKPNVPIPGDDVLCDHGPCTRSRVCHRRFFISPLLSLEHIAQCSLCRSTHPLSLVHCACVIVALAPVRLPRAERNMKRKHEVADCADFALRHSTPSRPSLCLPFARSTGDVPDPTPCIRSIAAFSLSRRAHPGGSSSTLTIRRTTTVVIIQDKRGPFRA
jgi:hypothetical protein